MAHYQLVIHKPPILLGGEQAHLPKHLQVPGELVLRLEQAIHQLAKAGFFTAGCKKAKNANACGIGKGLKNDFRLDVHDMHSCMIAQLTTRGHSAMRVRWLTFGLIAAGFQAPYAGADELRNCGDKRVDVAYSQPSDLVTACDALSDTLAYFRKIGFDFEPRFSVKFAERKSAEGVVSYGYVDLRSSIIVVYSSSYRRPWGLSWRREVAGSFLRHELAHIAVWQVLGGKAERLPREWHEFIAYATQLDLMGKELLKGVLTNFSDVHAFGSLSEVNEFTYGMNPDVFAVAAYLTYRERGAENFVRGLLRGEIVPPPFSFPFPVLPEQNPR